MRFSTNNIGAFLAVITGIVLIGTSVWPGAPQYTEYDSIFWVILSALIGIGFIVAAAIVNQHPGVSRALLAGGAILKILSGMLFGGLLDVPSAATFFDVLPAIVALVAAAIIGPIERTAAP